MQEETQAWWIRVCFQIIVPRLLFVSRVFRLLYQLPNNVFIKRIRYNHSPFLVTYYVVSLNFLDPVTEHEQYTVTHESLHVI